MGIYASRADKQWERQVVPGFSPPIEPDVFTETELSRRIENGSLRSVTQQSEVILTGTIVSKADRQYKGDNGRTGMMRTYTVRVAEVLKGGVSGTQAEFVLPWGGEYIPDWVRYTPRVEIGEQWLLFLRRDKHGLYPFSGRNSMLRINGDDLIFNAKLKYPLTRNETMQRVRSEVRHEMH
jgi:hypothetical protein